MWQGVLECWGVYDYIISQQLREAAWQLGKGMKAIFEQYEIYHSTVRRIVYKWISSQEMVSEQMQFKVRPVNAQICKKNPRRYVTFWPL